jgi:NADH:ubiquinone oxidoreductase subunit F (NADH-binding)
MPTVPAVPPGSRIRRRPLSGPPGPVDRLLPVATGPSYQEHLERIGELPSVDRGLVDEVLASGLRGRGGAGFPTGRKMKAVAERRGPAVVVANGTEGEPLSAKDRVLLTRRPHLVVDGVMAAAAAVNADRAVIAVDRAHPAVGAVLRGALAERSGSRRDVCPVEVVETPSRYVAGQETALISWLNGGDARPKFAARPHERGVDRRPTLVDNVETLAHLALIARFGADWFRLVGPPAEPGSMLLTVTGGVDHPGVVEVPMGTSLTGLLHRVGARRPHALLLGGYFGTWVGPDRIAGVRLSSAGLSAVGARPGCGVVVVVPDDACALAELAAVAAWYASQSAGQCGPCVVGLADIGRAVAGILHGHPEAEASARRWTAMVRGRGACQLPDGAAGFVDSALEALSTELNDHRHGRCQRPYRGYLPTPTPTSGAWR